MESKTELYIPAVFRSFQGFQIKDIREFRGAQRLELVLEQESAREHFCDRCGEVLGRQRDRYWQTARHLRVMGWLVTVCFWREKRDCFRCKKIRSERIDFLCPGSPHSTKEFAWWITRLTTETSVLATSRLESVGKNLCYRVDKIILRRLLAGYKIPKVRRIAVDEVYARGPKLLKPGENRDDLFFTVIVDIDTHKVIWVSTSRRKAALDEFFLLLGTEACEQIEVVATDQHEDYGASVREYCKNATLVWDKFHLLQNFEEAANKTRMQLHEEQARGSEIQRLSRGQFRFLFLKRASDRTKNEQEHINEVLQNNERFMKLEIIKERMLTFFQEKDVPSARLVWDQIGDWIWQAGFSHLMDWYRNLDRGWETLKNYFLHPVTTGVAEGINRVIKGLKWQAYGYKDMEYFKLKILQKAGYLNYRYCLIANF
jgi:transposase